MLVHDSGAETKLRRPDGSDVAARPGADNEEVVGSFGHLVSGIAAIRERRCVSDRRSCHSCLVAVLPDRVGDRVRHADPPVPPVPSARHQSTVMVKRESRRHSVQVSTSQVPAGSLA